MVHEKSQRLADLAEQLSEALITASICADEIRAIVQAELDYRPGSMSVGPASAAGGSTY